MSVENHSGVFPFYQTFVDNIAVLALPVSGSELHGVMCGYLSAGAVHEGEMYLRALMVKREKKPEIKAAALAMFELYGISKQQIAALDFEFRLLLPDDDTSLAERAQAFCEWCEGFTQGITLAGVNFDNLEEEDSQEALQHLFEFAHLDYESLDIDEHDEKALMEVSEYARMAVVSLSRDIQDNHSGKTHLPETTH